jgi:hypothetical protein
MDDSLMDEIAGVSVNEDENKKIEQFLEREFSSSFDDLEINVMGIDYDYDNEFDTMDDDGVDVVLSSRQLSEVTFNTEPLLIDYCCMCGLHKNNHSHEQHRFFPCLDEYRCKKCTKFFYQHDHRKKPCFTPYKYLS